MIKVPVHMFAFTDPVKVRVVEIPSQWDSDTAATLEDVFREGQNDFNPSPDCPSVSCGDVVELGDKFYIVAPVGFVHICRESFESLKACKFEDRRQKVLDLCEWTF